MAARALFHIEGQKGRRRDEGRKRGVYRIAVPAIRGKAGTGEPELRAAPGEYRDLVDDSIQKTFLKAYEEYDALKDAPYIEAWLFKVCRYRLMTALNTYRRRQKRHVPLEDDAALTERELMTAIDALPDRISSRETLERVLDTLNEREKGLVQAHFVDGVSCEELAKRQNTTIGAIRTALARLRKKARRLAEDERT